MTFDSFPLRVVFERNRTGFEETKDLPCHTDVVIAGRYQVTGYLGSAAFSKVTTLCYFVVKIIDSGRFCKYFQYQLY